MFNSFNKIKNSEKGQITVVIMIVIAVALIIYAVTLNLGRVSTNKTTVQIGANVGASYLASGMASYGHSLLMQQLGGEKKKCSSTGLLGAIVGAILAIVLAVVTWGAAWPLVALAVAGAVAAVLNVVLQVTVIQPGITSAWNKIAGETLEIEDQFLEGGMRQAIQTAATDPAQVADLYDLDQDGTFGLDSASQPYDRVSRFGLYYTTLFDGLQINFIPEAEAFQIDLQNFVYQIPDDGEGACPVGVICQPDEECVGGVCQAAWALFDPLPGSFVPGPTFPPTTFAFTVDPDPTHPCSAALNIWSECNLCCHPETTTDPRGPIFGTIPVRAGCCDCSTKPPQIQIPDPNDPTGVATITVRNPDFCADESCMALCGGNPVCEAACGDPALECGTWTTCQAQSPYGQVEPTLNTFYAWVFDPFFENTENTFFSFRELLGKDDEHQLYFKESSQPNWFPQFAPPPFGTAYYVEDATGFYDPVFYPPIAPAVADNRRGIFPFLWKINLWGIDLNDINVGDILNPVNDPFDQRCKWCDVRATGTSCDPSLPKEMDQLALTVDPAILTFVPTYCVDDDIDDVSMDITGTMEVDETVCVDPYNYTTGPFWKPGADRFCSRGDAFGDGEWPYEGQCPKYLNGGCFLDDNGNGVADCPEDCDASGNPIPALCNCGDPSASNAAAVDPRLFPEDIVDDMVYNLTVFITEANRLIAKSRGKLSTNFETWFADWQEWIDPGPLSAALGIPCYPFDHDDDSGTPDQCNDAPGQLFIWHRNIQGMLGELIALRDQGFQSAACGSPWCVPPLGCPGVSLFEETTFDANGNGVSGQIEDVIACLNFNIEGYDYTCNGGAPSLSCVRPAGTGQGNDFLYFSCLQTCNLAECSNLPRSVIPLGTYDPSAFAGLQTAPAREPDTTAMLQCMFNCSNANCMPPTMPLSPTGGGAPATYAYSGTIGNFDETLDCNFTDLNDNRGFLTLMRTALVEADPVCDMNPGGWLALTGSAAIEAANQVDKFTLRRTYLQGRLIELNNAIQVLTTANTEFNNFLTTSVANLIQARIDYDADPPDDWPFQVVYGWQDRIDPKTRFGAPGSTPYWHIVKVEARIPKRCENACGHNPPGAPDPAWPKVKTYTKKGGFKRCYELINTDGIVKMRVLRYDESPSSQGDPTCIAACALDPDCEANCNATLRFPNGQPIWKFKFFHPNPGRADVSAATLGTTCDPIMLTDPQVSLDEFKGAFIMNKRIGTAAGADPTCLATCGGLGAGCPNPPCNGNCAICGDITPGNNFNCWNRSHKILANAGIAHETCAQYYHKEGARPGLTFSFIDCPEF